MKLSDQRAIVERHPAATSTARVAMEVSPNATTPQEVGAPGGTASQGRSGIEAAITGNADMDNTNAKEQLWSIGELAAVLDVTTRTIRFYEDQNLITPDRNKGARVYGRRDRARMLLILRGKNLGFSLDDIRQYLSLYDADPNQITQTQLLLQKVQASITALEQKRVDLDRTLSELKLIQTRAQAFLAERGGD